MVEAVRIFKRQPSFCMPACVQSAVFKLGGIIIPQMNIARELAWLEYRGRSDQEIREWYYNVGPNPPDLVDAQKRIHPNLGVRYKWDSSLEELEQENKAGSFAIVNYSVVRKRLEFEKGEGRNIEEEHYLCYDFHDPLQVYLGDPANPKKPMIVSHKEFYNYWRESKSELYAEDPREERHSRPPRSREAMFLSWEK